MNDEFRRLCDLVADAEDLVGRIADSDDPQLRTLGATVTGSVERIKRELRDETRRLAVRRARRMSVRLAGATVLGLTCAAAVSAWWMLRRRRSPS